MADEYISHKTMHRTLPCHAYASLQFALVPAVATFHFPHEPFAQPTFKRKKVSASTMSFVE